jgi:hypothetical protein
LRSRLVMTMGSLGARAQIRQRDYRFALIATRDSEWFPTCLAAVELTDNDSGGYTTTNSLVKSGRVFNLALADLAREYPTVQTWNSCTCQEP